MRRTLEVLKQQYRGGTADASHVYKAQNALTEALVETARSREERIELLTQHCTTLEDSLLIAETRFEDGSANELDAIEARASLLQGRSDSCKLRLPLQSSLVAREPMRQPVKPCPLSFESQILSQSAKCIAVKPREAGDAN